MASKLPREALPLLLLYLDNGKEIIGRTKFQKLVFIIEHEVPEVKIYFDRGYNWDAWHFGPFSDGLLDDLMLLDYWNLINISEYTLNIDDEFVTSIYRITDKGREVVKEKILPQLPEELIEKLEQLKKKFNKMSIIDIVKYVYKKYSNYTVRSKIREIITNRG